LRLANDDDGVADFASNPKTASHSHVIYGQTTR